MPRVSIWMIRLSLLYLISGITIGALLLTHKAFPMSPQLWTFLPVHIELLIFGWIIQFTLGTAYWMLPRFLNSKERGNALMAVLMVVFLNVGIGVVITSNFSTGITHLAFLGRAFETLAVILFASLHWKRIVSYAKH